MRLIQFVLNSDPTADPFVGIQPKEEGSEYYVNLTSYLASTGVTISGMRSFLALGDAGMAAAAEAAAGTEHRVAAADARLRAPLDDAQKIICVGMNYVDHCTEQGAPIPERPLLFSKFASCIIGSGERIEKTPETAQLDWEVELAVVIGKRARRVSAEDAPGYIAGFTVAHDVSARDVQLKPELNGGQWMLGKTMDTFAPLGPAIVTRDELPGGDPHKLRLRCIVNGETKQDSNTDQLVHNTSEVVAFASKFFTLVPGDIILTGTPPGVGCFLKPEPVFLKDGDEVTCAIDGIGSITNKVVEVDDAGRPTGAAAAAAGGAGSS